MYFAMLLLTTTTTQANLKEYGIQTAGSRPSTYLIIEYAYLPNILSFEQSLSLCKACHM